MLSPSLRACQMAQFALFGTAAMLAAGIVAGVPESTPVLRSIVAPRPADADCFIQPYDIAAFLLKESYEPLTQANRGSINASHFGLSVGPIPISVVPPPMDL